MTKPTLPTEISEFYVYGSDGVTPLVDDDGNPVIKKTPNTRTLNEVKELIVSGASEKAIKACYESYQRVLPHRWKDTVLAIDAKNKEIQQQREDIAIANANIADSESPQDLPDYKTDWPDRAAEQYTARDYSDIDNDPEFSDVLAETTRTNDKLNGFVFNSVTCSVTEADQNGWGAITVLLDAAASAGFEYSPVNFRNENGNTVTLATRAEWDGFILTGAQSRADFFQ